MNPKQEALVILTPGFPSSMDDSTCLPMQQDFVRTFRKLRPNSRIIVLTLQYPYHTTPYEWCGSEVVPFNGRNRGGFTRLTLRMQVTRTLKKIQSKYRISALFSFWYGECAWIGNRYAKENKLKHFCWILGQDARKENPYPRRSTLPATQLLAVSEFIQDEFEHSHGLRPRHVLHPGIAEDLHPGKEVSRDIDLLAVGSLIPLKQFEIFLEVVRSVNDVHPQVKAVLAGGGPEMKQLIARADSLGISGKLEILEEQPYPSILQLMQRAKILVHPSSYEGFSGVCLEALYSGCRVISFCQPTRSSIRNWEIAADTKDMIRRSQAILEDRAIVFAPVTDFTMSSTVSNFIALLE